MVQRSIELTQPDGSLRIPEENYSAEQPEELEWVRQSDTSSNPQTDQLEVLSTNLVATSGGDTAAITSRPWRGKRVFDIVTVLIIAVPFAPIMLVVCAWLLVTRGPVLFRHKRVGRNGVVFTCYKFRTMVPDAEHVLEKLLETQPELRAQWKANHKLADDPRVTSLGRFLRKTSLDELPQLWNVLKGDMSLVGPRPIVQEEVPRYGNTIHYYLAVRPGITGLWQVSGRNDTAYEDRVILDRAYVLSAGFCIDLGILLGTIGRVLRRSGAY